MTTIHRSRQTTGPVRVAPVDIAHSRHRSAFVLGPVPIPDAEVATDRIRRLAAVGPAARIGLRPSTVHDRWIFDPAGLDDAVSSAPQIDDHSELLRIAREAPGEQLRVVLAGDHLALDYDHGLGDTALLNVIAEVLMGVRDPADPDLWRGHRLVVPRRGRRHPGRRPAPADCASPIPSTPASPAACRGHAADPADPADPPDSADRADRPRPLRRATRRTRPQPARGEHVRAHHRALVSALAEAGITLNPMVTLPFDARGYLPSGVTTLANFSAGLVFDVRPSTSPRELQSELSTSARMGRPAANLLVTTVKARRRLRETGTLDHPPGLPCGDIRVADLLHSSVGVIGGPDSRWQFTDAERATVVGAADPPSPSGITVTSAMVAGGIILSATLRDDVFEADVVGTALDRVAFHVERLVGAPPQSA